MLLEIVVRRAGAAPGAPERFRALNEAVIEKQESGHTVRLLVVDRRDAVHELRRRRPHRRHAHRLHRLLAVGARARSSRPSTAPCCSRRCRRTCCSTARSCSTRTSTSTVEVLGHRPADLSVDGRRVAGLAEGDTRARAAPAPDVARFVRFGAAPLPPDPEGQVRARATADADRAAHPRTSGVIEAIDLVLGRGHDRAHRRDRRRQDDAGRGHQPAASAAARRRHAWCARAPPRPASRAASCSATSEVVLARVVPADGRSRAYVDGRLATVATLAEAGARLVDLHGQHAHQCLLAPGHAARRPRPLRRRRPRPAAAPGASALTELDAAPGRARRRRPGPGPRDRPAAVPGRRAGRAPALDDPDEDERLDAEEDLLADAAGPPGGGRGGATPC